MLFVLSASHTRKILYLLVCLSYFTNEYALKVHPFSFESLQPMLMVGWYSIV